jgi:hypothetical protein
MSHHLLSYSVSAYIHPVQTMRLAAWEVYNGPQPSSSPRMIRNTVCKILQAMARTNK